MNACTLIAPHVSLSGWRGDCLGAGWAPVAGFWAAVLVTTLVVLVGLYHVYRGSWTDKRTRLHRLLAMGSIILACLCLAVAMGRPLLVRQSDPGDRHLILLLDQSESAHRQEVARRARLLQVAEQMRLLSSAFDKDPRVSLIDFAARQEIRLNRGSLADGITMLLGDEMPFGFSQNGTDIGSALKLAKALASEQSDEDIILLLSDGLDTSGYLQSLGKSEGASLPNLFAYSFNAGSPAEGIVSSYLPAVVKNATEPNLRVVFDPGSARALADQTISLFRNGERLALDWDILKSSSAVQSLKLPVRFDGRGLQFVDFRIGDQSRVFQNRIFTLVEAPIRILGLGDTDFLSVLPKDQFDVEQLPDLDLNLKDMDDFDILVLGSVRAQQLGQERLSELSKAISERGLGLMIVNGPMVGRPDEPTVVQSYHETALDLLLPVSPDPKFLLEDPPPRDTIVLVDTSGSMSGGGLAAARSAIADLLDYMRPQDSLQVITFGGLSSGRQRGDGVGKGAIRSFASRFPTGDSSDVSRAFEAALRLTGNYTSVFLITDGMVNPYDYAKAGLSFYYLQYNSGSGSLNREIAGAARQSQILRAGQGLTFKPDFFDPQEKSEFFSPDPVSPRVVTPIKDISGGIETSGVAFSYARADAVRALISDGDEGEPVLAFRQSDLAGNGNVAAFLSDFDANWTDNEAGRKAIAASLLQLVKWSERSRYGFELSDLGDEIGLRITILSDGTHQALPEALSATLVTGLHKTGIALKAVGSQKGVFEGRFALPKSPHGATKWLLFLEEEGRGALFRPQSIPISLPDPVKGETSRREAATFGVNLQALEAIAKASGGALDDFSAFDADGRRLGVPPWPVHDFFILVAALLFGFAFFAKGGRL
ncbi:VWA domain-containing protein [uncultured Cohaesibacter sp.]|uniref:VWA domain-containing protein n=1 Tax=uncultured Cohaesibacter sp. TaxID=1002546 RepID=UPI002930C9AA|nr:VWA domain-containing protein [uncultured Cohaesibacter sp.]